MLANINRDPDQRSDPFTPADFLPGAKTREDELREWAEAVARGETFEADPEEKARFKQRMMSTFGNLKTADPAC